MKKFDGWLFSVFFSMITILVLCGAVWFWWTLKTNPPTGVLGEVMDKMNGIYLWVALVGIFIGLVFLLKALVIRKYRVNGN